MVRNFLTALLLSAALIGCRATPPTADEIAKANLGTAPTQETAQSACATHLSRMLFDPMSAVINYGTVQRGWYSRPMSTTAKFAWMLPTSINAKNRMGGYVGFRSVLFFLLEGTVVATATTNDKGYVEVEEFGNGGLTKEQAGLTPTRKPESP